MRHKQQELSLCGLLYVSYHLLKGMKYGRKKK